MCRSRTVLIIFLNSAPIYWFSKCQTSVETSSFGSEFITMKQCCEYVIVIHYKLHIMGMPIDLPTYTIGDNQSVLCNTFKTHSSLKNKSSSKEFHFVRKGTANNEWRTAYTNIHFNTAYILTKSLDGGEKRSKFIGYILNFIN